MADITTKYKSRWKGKEVDEAVEKIRTITPAGIGAMGAFPAFTDSINDISIPDGVYSLDFYNDASSPLSGIYGAFVQCSGDFRTQMVIGSQITDADIVRVFVRRYILGQTRWSGWNEIISRGNKPVITYTGNGSATARTIDTGGIGNCCVIHSDNGAAIVTGINGIAFNAANIVVIPNAQGHINAGALTLATTDSRLNAAGVTYHCQVL